MKVIEEPPQKTYFIIELQQIENTSDTIKSRCQEIRKENYTEEEILQMIDKINSSIDDLDKIMIADVAQNYYKLELFNKYGIKEIYN